MRETYYNFSSLRKKNLNLHKHPKKNRREREEI